MKITTADDFICVALRGDSFRIKNNELESTSGSLLSRIQRALRRLSCWADESLRTSKAALQQEMLRIMTPAFPGLTLPAPSAPSEGLFPGTLALQLIDQMLACIPEEQFKPEHPLLEKVITGILNKHAISPELYPESFMKVIHARLKQADLTTCRSVKDLKTLIKSEVKILKGELKNPSRVCGQNGGLDPSSPVVSIYVHDLLRTACAADNRIDSAIVRERVLSLLPVTVPRSRETLYAVLEDLVEGVVSQTLAVPPAPGGHTPAEIPFGQMLILNRIIAQTNRNEVVQKILKRTIRPELARMSPLFADDNAVTIWVENKVGELTKLLASPGPLLLANGCLDISHPLAESILACLAEAGGKTAEEKEALRQQLLTEAGKTPLNPDSSILPQLRNLPALRQPTPVTFPRDLRTLTSADGKFDLRNTDLQDLLTGCVVNARAQYPGIAADALFEALQVFLRGQQSTGLSVSLEDYINGIITDAYTATQELAVESPGQQSTPSAVVERIALLRLLRELETAGADIPEGLIRVVISKALEAGGSLSGDMSRFLTRRKEEVLAVLQELRTPALSLEQNRINIRHPAMEAALLWAGQRRPRLDGEGERSLLTLGFAFNVRACLEATPPGAVSGPLYEFIRLHAQAAVLQNVQRTESGGLEIIEATPAAFALNALLLQALDRVRSQGYPYDTRRRIQQAMFEELYRPDMILEETARNIEGVLQRHLSAEAGTTEDAVENAIQTGITEETPGTGTVEENVESGRIEEIPGSGTPEEPAGTGLTGEAPGSGTTEGQE